MEKGEDFFEISLGSKPNNFDVAITSINSYGSVGELNTIVLDAFGLKYEELYNLNLDKGFDVINQGNKAVLFIVTVGNGIVLSNLKSNLQSAFTTHLKSFSNKKVWIPLMGTGSGKLTYEESFLTTKQVLIEYQEYIAKYKIQINISIPNDPKGKKLYQLIENSSSNDIKNLKFFLSDFYKKIDLNKISFYLVDENLINENEFIFGDKYANNNFKIDDFIIIKKSIYSNQNNLLYISSIAVLTNKISEGIYAFDNVTSNLNVTLTDIYGYNEDLALIEKGRISFILESLNKNDLIDFINNFNIQIDNKTKSKKVSSNIKVLPSLVADIDSGEDYLDIKNDIEAFARVIAAKSFQPPLAIALLGKWGSGKSFFMRKLKENIQFLSNNNPQEAFCEGVVHVHFNAWSYMDANLWASIVTRIFEGLDEYINDLDLSKKEKKEIENELFQKLTISKEEHLELENQQNQVKKRLHELKTHKKHIKRELNNKISSVRKSTLVDITNKIDSEFKVQEKIQETLNDNPTFVDSVQKFESIVPKQYWENPSMFYNELKSIYAFLKTFFYRKKLKTNIFWILAFLILIGVTPVLTFLTNLLLSWHDFRISDKTWITITIIGTLFTRSIDTYLKLKKQIAPFWHIKEKYEKEKEEAIFKFKQEQKAIKLEINQKNEEIIQVNKEINTNLQLQTNLKFKLENALSTHALYTFIEKRANSEDYKKHLGIVSLIRKDFEILSGLLTDHHTELVSKKDSIEFKKLFDGKKSLERIILYIDDLDRCPEERVVEVLEAVNLLMAFPLFVVVVGVDPRWVKKALEKKYKNQFAQENDNEEAISPSNYLEKIFQVPFHLKDADDISIKGMIKTLTQAKPNALSVSNEAPLLTEVYDYQDFVDPDLEVIYHNTSKNENETIVDTNIFDHLFKKETIEALDITEIECELLQNMSEIIGNNPRAIKRFVNIYRIIKTHEDFLYDSKTKEIELLAVMFLLALPMGNFKGLMPSFNEILKNETAFNYYLSPSYNTLPDDILHLKNKLNSLLLKTNKAIFKIDSTYFRKHYHFVKRFTFKNI